MPCYRIPIFSFLAGLKPEVATGGGRLTGLALALDWLQPNLPGRRDLDSDARANFLRGAKGALKIGLTESGGAAAHGVFLGSLAKLRRLKRLNRAPVGRVQEERNQRELIRSVRIALISL